MSYDLYLFHSKPGSDDLHTIREILEDDEESEFIDNSPVDPIVEAKKKEIATKLTSRYSNFKMASPDYAKIAQYLDITEDEARLKHRHIEIDALDIGLQIILSEHRADITLPYWHSGDKAHSAMKQIWQTLEILENECQFITYDPQLDKILNLKTDYKLVEVGYTGISEKLPDIISRN
jgi:hypothetical protein